MAKKGYSPVSDLNLSEREIIAGREREDEVIWHPHGKKCPKCGRDLFLEENWDKWVCASWLYMEGGCPHMEDATI